MVRPWPNPADTPADRARAIARSYRAALRKVDPSAADALDQAAAAFGELWMLAQLDNGEDLMSRDDLAARAGVKPDTVSAWTTRGLITRYPGGYRWSEVDEVLTKRRLRRSARNSDQLDL